MLLAVHISSFGCTWEVWRALKKLELLLAIISRNSYASMKSMKLTMWLAVVLNKYMKFLGKIVPFTLLSQYSGKVGD